jgi:hypothetical protein
MGAQASKIRRGYENSCSRLRDLGRRIFVMSYVNLLGLENIDGNVRLDI